MQEFGGLIADLIRASVNLNYPCASGASPLSPILKAAKEGRDLRVVRSAFVSFKELTIFGNPKPLDYRPAKDHLKKRQGALPLVKS